MRRQTCAKSRGASVSAPLNLASLRQRKGITLEQIAEATKISTRFLRAIEDEEFDKLPGGIFNTNYLRQYAACLGIDGSKLLARYEATVNPGAAAQDAVEDGRSFLLRWFRAPAH